jgi:hypothetical protein
VSIGMWGTGRGLCSGRALLLCVCTSVVGFKEEGGSAEGFLITIGAVLLQADY